MATALLRGKVDKAGDPLIEHALRVARAVRPQDAAHRLVAVLHDVIENAGAKLEEVVKLVELFDPEANALNTITRRSHEVYEDYIERVAANPIARAVKVADLEDNLRIGSKIELTETLRDRYKKALVRLLNIINC